MQPQNQQNLEQPETFKDIARICIKKINKGPFDMLATLCYRLKKLTEFYPRLNQNRDPKEQILALIKQGLQYKSFDEMQQELKTFRSMEFIESMPSLKEFYSYVDAFAKQNDIAIAKAFLVLMQGIIAENRIGLEFLQSFIGKQIDTEERKLAILKSTAIQDIY